jgi:DNA-directed RNA polymerase subunit K/omega
MSNNPLATNVPGEKIRLLGDDEENPVDMMGNDDEDDGDNSVIVDDVGSDGGDDDDGEDDNGEEDIIDEDDDGDDGDINSDDGIDNTLDRVTSPSARIGAKHGRSSGLQSIDTVVPIQFLADANDGGDMTDDDIDVASMSGNVTGDDEYDDDDEDPETYLQKFDLEMNRDLLLSHHPTQFNKNDTEISVLCQLTRNASNNVIDPLHKTTPFLTKYEKTRVLGQRAKQLNSGSKPYVVVPEHILDGYIIAQIELAQKRIPFIIERPIHGGGSEYWRVRDLEIL